MMELHSNLGGAVFNTMARLNSKQCRSAVASCHGSPHGLHCTCLLAGLCERSFCLLIFKPFFLLHPPFGTLSVSGLISIPLTGSV